jgi:hypothetical protein
MHRFIDGGERMQAGDQQRSAITAIVDDLNEVSALLGVERLRALIIDDHSNGCGLGLGDGMQWRRREIR